MTWRYDQSPGSDVTLLALYDAVEAAEEFDLAEEARDESFWAEIRVLRGFASDDDAADPVDILDHQRLIEAVLDAVGLRLRIGGGKGGAALVDELRADVIGIIARRRLDDGEGDHAQDEEHRYGGGYAHGQES